MTPRLQLRRVFKLATALVLFLSAQHLFAQGCASCYTTAAAAKEAAVRALRHGILILLFPPLILFCGILVAAMRKRGESSCDLS